MRAGVFAFAAMCWMLQAGQVLAAGSAQRPLLLELFTSQGCSSCPPADAVLRELSGREDLLPLAFHVDYWNHLGWVDPFSSAAFSSRQQDYAAVRGSGVYTPQLLIEGKREAVGSNRSAIESGIEAARQDAQGAASSIRRKGGEAIIDIGTVPDTGAAAQVYLLSFDSRDETEIRAGENAGRKLVYTNVVRSLRKLGEWHNQPLHLSASLQPEETGDRLALVVQDPQGTVWAVASTARSVNIR